MNLEAKILKGTTERQPFNEWKGTPFWHKTASGHSFFLWLHLPPPGTVTMPFSVVLCPPFGHEAMVTHRAYRQLALRLLENNIPSVRFDYLGSGDSAGTFEEHSLAQTWTSQMESAAQLLRSHTGHQGIVLFGVRLGATLAASVAHHIGATGLVMVAPITSGKALMRELRAFRSLGAHGQQLSDGPGIPLTEVTGYPLSAPFIESITKIDLNLLPAPPAQEILFVCRDDMPQGEQRLAQTWKTKYNVEPNLMELPGYGAMAPDDAYKSVVPFHLWEGICGWLRQKKASLSAGHLKNVDQDTSSLMSSVHPHLDHAHWRETWIEKDGLFGILTIPRVPMSHHPLIVLNNIGANHRVGPHRLCVSIARALAENGFAVIRFDRSGIGDSPPSERGGENEVYASGGVSDVKKMIDFGYYDLGCQHVSLLGLCSGAYYSYHTALADERVKRMILINPITFQWREGDSLDVRNPKNLRSTHFYGQKIRSIETWKRLFNGEIHARRIVQELGTRFILRAFNFMKLLLIRSRILQPRLSSIGRNFLTLVKRGVHIRFIFDADEGGLDMIQSHLGQNLSFMPKNCHLKIFTGADHTFSPIWAQKALVSYIVEELSERPLQSTKS